MRYKGKLAGVSGRKLLFGDRDAKTGKYAKEITLVQDGQVKRGEWPDFDPANLSDLKNGLEITCHGVDETNPAAATCHTVTIFGKAASRAASIALAEREEAKAKAGKE